METFSLLKYWSAAKTSTPTSDSPAAAGSAAASAASSTDSDVVDVEIDGSFFDLDLTTCLPAKQQIQLLTISNSFSSNSDVDILIATPSSGPNSLLLKSATKLRVFALGFRKLKSDSDSSSTIVSPKITSTSTRSFKFFAGSRKTKAKNHNPDDDGGEEKKSSKEAQAPVARKYVSSRMIKPLYVRVSRRYNYGVGGEVGTKMGFSGPLTSSPAAKEAAMAKSRSPVSQPPPVHHEEDGIQSAIAHCKRCFSQELETLPVQPPRTGGEEGKE